MKATDQPQVLEAWLHDYLKHRRSGGGREWFTLSDKEALEVVVLMYQEPSAYLFFEPRISPTRMESTSRALEVFREEGRISTSLLQRRLSMGYARAARTVDQLIAEGHVVVDDETHERRLAA